MKIKAEKKTRETHVCNNTNGEAPHVRVHGNENRFSLLNESKLIRNQKPTPVVEIAINFSKSKTHPLALENRAQQQQQ